MSKMDAWTLSDKFQTHELFSGRITKTFLMTLPAGARLYLQGFPEQFDETITEHTDRQRLWEKMSRADAGIPRATSSGAMATSRLSAGITTVEVRSHPAVEAKRDITCRETLFF